MLDVIVIGAGPAGVLAALHAADLGARTALITRDEFGGMAANDGPVPVRTLAHAARPIREARQLGLYGITVSEPALDYLRLLARVDYLRSGWRLQVLREDQPLWTRHDGAGKPGAQLSSWSFVENLKRYAREAGIGKIHMRQTRHTFARMVAKRSGSLSETQDALGHRHASTTRIYVESIAVKMDKYSQHILEALELPDFEIDQFIRDYTNLGCVGAVRDLVVPLTINGAGIRDIERVLFLSTNTILKTLR